MAEIKDELDVLVIGAGFAGICAGVKLQENDISSFHIVDKADGIGGTWWNNRYPGAACDVPSHFYCFSFEPNPNWSRKYSPQAEIQQYVEHCADKYGLKPKISLGKKLDSLTYDENSGRWRASFSDGTTTSARFVINGQGGLHKPAIPDFDGLDAYEGRVMHTAEWDQDYDYRGKRVAMVGSAASAIQVLPVVAQTAEQMTVFQRTPNYISRRNDYDYSPAWKARFRKHPWLMKVYSWFLRTRMDMFIYPIIRRPIFRARMSRLVNKYMKSQVQDRLLHDGLRPDYEIGCKRILISDNYFAALNRDNVKLEQSGIKRFTTSGIETTDGKTYDVDLVIMATGYDLEGHQRSIEITGKDGLTLADYWAKGSHAYKGAMVPHFPNLFLVTGPNTGVGTTSVVYMIEQTMGWIMKCLNMLGADQTIVVKEEVEAAYNDMIQDALKDTVWASGCDSWYLTDDGRNEQLYPWNAKAFKQQMSTVNRAEFAIRDVISDKSAGPGQRQAAE